MPEQEKGLVLKQQDPIALINTNEGQVIVNRAKEVKEVFIKQKTDKSYVRKRGDFPYVPYAYMLEKFEQVIPLYRERLVVCEFHPQVLQVFVCLEITDLTTGNTRIGTGAARVQVSTETKKAVEAGERQLRPFDILDYDKQIKSARTQAKKDAIKEFGVCADIYDRIIVPDELISKMQKEFNEIVKSIESPLERMNWNKEWQANIEICKKKNRRDMFFITLYDLKKKLNLLTEKEIEDVTDEPESD